MLLGRLLIFSAVLVLFAGFLGVTDDPARAEGGTCPPGYYPVNSPGVMGCAPIPGYGGSDEAAPPEPRWESRWGAVAAGGEGFGTVENLPSRRLAEKQALQKCREMANEPTRCKIYSFANTCAAFAWGVDAYSWQVNEDLNVATSAAMRQCGTMTTDCQIFYSACMAPVRIR